MRIKQLFILIASLWGVAVFLAACTPEMFSTPPVDNSPALISGQVDMSTAPPYLNDPVLGSLAMTVVFFNLDNGMHWYEQTTQGDPSFQASIPPGTYQVVAYGIGVGDLPFVVAGYTGEDPSCGKELKTITVQPGTQIEDIVIADWNWTCDGTAQRQDKPADVPLP